MSVAKAGSSVSPTETAGDSSSPEFTGTAPRAEEHRWVALGLLILTLGAAVAISWRWMNANGFFVRPPATEGVPYRLEAARLMIVLQDDGFLEFLRTAYFKPHDHTPLLAMTGAVVGALVRPRPESVRDVAHDDGASR